MSFAADAVTRARAAAKARLSGDARTAALAALDELGEAEAAALDRAGKTTATAFLAAVWDRAPRRAQAIWLEQVADAEERIRARELAADAAEAAAAQRRADAELLLDAVKRAGMAAFRVVIPFLLAAVGL